MLPVETGLPDRFGTFLGLRTFTNAISISFPSDKSVFSHLPDIHTAQSLLFLKGRSSKD
jgi:hypothetical protein